MAERQPEKQDNTFNAIRMGFSNKMLVEMELTDSFGNNTRIRFANQQKNPALAASHFSFTPPKGLMWSAATEQPPTTCPPGRRHLPAGLLQKRSTCRV
jgi:hypothetical protein